MVNQYPATCAVCDCSVPANGGVLKHTKRGWQVRHIACESGKTSVIEVTMSSGAKMRKNVNGRCIDAPCCGCCS